jgi:hypothetical protein
VRRDVRMSVARQRLGGEARGHDSPAGPSRITPRT